MQGLHRRCLGLQRPRTFLQDKENECQNQQVQDLKAAIEEGEHCHSPTKEPSAKLITRKTWPITSCQSKRTVGAFKSPFVKPTGQSVPIAEEDVSPDVHFRVLWTKDIKKKHRHHEDGVLCVMMGKYALYNSEGRLVTQKAVGRTNADLKADSILQIGGFELEITAPLSAEDFARGTCFEAGFSTATNLHPPNWKLQKGFSLSARKRQKTDTNSQHGPELHPNAVSADQIGRNAVTAERLEPPRDAYILNAGHPEQDDQGQPISDVWLDPFLYRCLRPHQLEGLQFLYNCISGQHGTEANGCILADEMGLGKTLTAISLIWVLLRRGPRGHPTVKKVIVVTPASLVQNWAKEVGKWLGRTRLDPEVVLGDRQEAELQLRAFRTGYRSLLIVSYDLCRIHADLLKDCRCDLMVCDEGHRLKNDGTQIARALGRIHSPRRILLTGTPLQNDLQELYALMDFVAPGLLGSRDAFRTLYTDCIARSREPGAAAKDQALGKARQEELTRRTQPFLLRRTVDVLRQALPPRTEFLIFCRLPPLQLALYQHFLRSKAMGRLLCNPSGAPSADALMCVTTLRKLLVHPSTILSLPAGEDPEVDWDEVCRCFPEEDGAEKGPDPTLSGKLFFVQTLLREIHRSTKDKVAVVSISTQALDIISQLLIKEGFMYLRLDGATPVAKRMAIVDRFNDRQSKETVLLLSCKAGGVGLNLVGANRMVLFDPDWNPANDAQAKARVWREGQQKPVFIYRLFCTGTLEEKILQRQQTKTGLSLLVVDESRADCRSHWGRDELRQLFTLNTVDNCDTYQEESVAYNPSQIPQDLDPVLCRALGAVAHVSFVKHYTGPEIEAELLPQEEVSVSTEQHQEEDNEAPANGEADPRLLIPCGSSNAEGAREVHCSVRGNDGIDIGDLQRLITVFDSLSDAETETGEARGTASDVEALEVEGPS